MDENGKIMGAAESFCEAVKAAGKETYIIIVPDKRMSTDECPLHNDDIIGVQGATHEILSALVRVANHLCEEEGIHPAAFYLPGLVMSQVYDNTDLELPRDVKAAKDAVVRTAKAMSGSGLSEYVRHAETIN